MAWLHTWVGLVFGWLLFAIFLTGTLSCFKDEINHWAQPEITRHELDPVASLAVAERYLSEHAAGASRWFIGLPDERQPTLSLYWQIPGKPGRSGFVQQQLDALSGAPVQARDSRGGEFFLRFHYELQMGYPWGRWLASIAAMAMLVALVSGIITHKKIFREFFTFRPAKGQRSWLDGHNLIGVLVLPFHLMITYSSLVMFMSMTMPAGISVNYGGNVQAYFAELLPAGAPPSSRQGAAPSLPLTQLYRQVPQHWPDARIGAVTVNNPGDATATVLFARDDADRVAYRPGDGIQFSGVDGHLIGAYQSDGMASTLAASFYGLHMGHFAGPLLRWLYFLAGLGSTAMIGTGLVMWLNKRRLKQAKASERRLELRLVEVLNLAGMAGLVLAIAGFFLANRLLPLELAQRGDWEVRVFFLTWALAALHAGLRPVARAWREQLGLAALLMLGVPLIGLATPYGLWSSIRDGDRMLAGVDLGLLASGCLLAWGVRKLIAHAGAKPRSRTARAAAMLEREVH